MKFLIISILLVLSINAEAYLDPGTGSMLLQVVLGGVAAIGVVIKLYWHRLKVAFGLSQKENIEDDSV